MDEYWCTPEIVAAARQGDHAKARRLLEAGADPNDRESMVSAGMGWDYGSALEAAAANGDLEMVRLLVSHGANASAPGTDPPMVQAIDHNHLAVVEFLLDQGVRPDQRYDPLYNPHETFIDVAIKRGSGQVVRLFRERGARVPDEDAQEAETDLEEIRELLEADRLDDVLDKLGTSPPPWSEGLADAARRGDHEKTEGLVAMGAPLPDASVKTRSAGENRAAPPQSPDDLLERASWGDRLQDAVRWGDADAIDCLLYLGAPIGEPASDGRTALHEAALRGKTRVAEALLEGGAPLDAVDREGKTPLDLALASGHTQVVEMLKRRGA